MEKISKHNYEAFWLDYMEGNLDEQVVASLFAFLEENPELRPDLEAEDMITLAPEAIEIEELIFEDKQSLKHITEETEERILAYLEAQLSPAEKNAFEQELNANTALQQEVSAYQKTFLSGAAQETFPSKNLLKKSTIPEETIIAYLEGQLSFSEMQEVENILSIDEKANAELNAYKRTILEANTSVVYPDKKALKREAKVVRLIGYRSVLSIAASIVLLFGLFWLIKDSKTEASKDSNGSIVLQKLKTSKKHAAHSLKPGEQSNTLYAGNPFLTKRIKTPGSNKQDSASKSLPLIPQNPVVNIIQPKDSSKKNEVKNSLSPLEPRSLIALNPYNENETDPKISRQEKQPLSTSAFVAEKINKAAWGKDEDAENEGTKAIAPEKKKVKGFDVLALLGKGLKKLGNQRSDAKKIESEDQEYTEYVVTIGSLSVSKKVAN